jgi:hypothetical protein
MPHPLDEPEGDGYELLVPFVACVSQGGPFDDNSFVAGFQAGQLDQALAAAAVVTATEVVVMTFTALTRQLELIAMRRGFPLMTAEVVEAAPEWSNITFRTTQA